MVVRHPFPAVRPATLLAILVLACGGDDPTSSAAPGPTPPAPVPPALRITAGAAVSDTVDAQLAQALSVEVRGRTGAPEPGLVVRFEALPTADTARRAQPAVRVCGLLVPTCGAPEPYVAPATLAQAMAETTDARGIARAIVRLGTIPGPATVRVVVPEYGLVDSATFVVRPGAPLGLQFELLKESYPAGISRANVAVGSTMTLSARVVDRYGNVRADPLTYGISPTGGHLGSVAIDAASGRLTARDVGLPWVTVRTGTHVDSVQMHVVPAGRLLLGMVGGLATTFSMMDTDGGARLDMPSYFQPFTSSQPRLDASNHLVLATNRSSSSFDNAPGTVLVVDTLGAIRRRLDAPEIGYVVAARPLADGSILALSYRVRTLTQTEGSLIRIAASGAVTLVRSIPDFADGYRTTDISPDGRRVAYLARIPNGSRLTVMDVSTGATTPLDQRASVVRWSPSGERLAYILNDGTDAASFGYRALVVVNHDGTGRRTIGATRFYERWVVWSPDERFVAAPAQGATALYVRLSDGLEIPAIYVTSFSIYTTMDFSAYEWR